MWDHFLRISPLIPPPEPMQTVPEPEEKLPAVIIDDECVPGEAIALLTQR